MKTKYEILWSCTQVELADMVQTAIREGWEPQGGLCYGERGGSKCYSQAIVRDDRKVLFYWKKKPVYRGRSLDTY